MSSSEAIDIVPAASVDKASWQRLYEGYGAFYKRDDMTMAIKNVWEWLNDPDHDVEGVVARLNGEAVGLAHFRRMPSPLRGEFIGFLDDLFVDPAVRGQGVATALFDHLEKVRGERGWAVIRWITAEDNATARSLYDRIGKQTTWVTYEIPA